MKHAFTYHWKLWTIPEILEMLQEAGFAEVHVWMRCMIVSPTSNNKCQVDVTCLLLQPFPVAARLIHSCLGLWVCAYSGQGCLDYFHGLHNVSSQCHGYVSALLLAFAA